MYLSANCICRIDPLVDVMRPNWGLDRFEFGNPHAG